MEVVTVALLEVFGYGKVGVGENLASTLAVQPIFRMSLKPKFFVHLVDYVGNVGVVRCSDMNRVAVILVKNGELMSMSVVTRVRFAPVFLNKNDDDFFNRSGRSVRVL
jgi:hypothetical protein